MLKLQVGTGILILACLSFAFARFECNRNCSKFVYNRINNQHRLVECNVQRRMNPENEFGMSGSVSKPRLVDSQRLWYFFHDSITNSTRIALNITWLPADDGTVRSLRGYRIVVYNRNRLMTASLYFNITGVYEAGDSIRTPYSYSCIGRKRLFSVKPSDTMDIEITSFPSTSNSILRRRIVLPSCIDREMRKTFECRNKVVKIKVLNGCVNRSRTILYKVPAPNSTSARLLFCQIPSPTFKLCIAEVSYADSLPVTGKYKLKLPVNFSPESHYIVQVWNPNLNSIRYFKDVSFADC